MDVFYFFFLQMFVPNYRKIYGSQHTMTNLRGGFERGKHYFYKVELTKYHLIALDQPSELCDSESNNPDTSSCLLKFIERELGCRPRIYGVDGLSQKHNYCNSSNQLKGLANISTQFSLMNANNIYSMTGCLPSCERDEYERSIVTLSTHDRWASQETNRSQLHLQISFPDGSYEVKEQYLLYDFDSFIADVGGFLGLLLGCSAFSLYKVIADLLVRFRAACCKSKIRKAIVI